MCTQAGSFLQVDRVHTDSPYPTSPYLWSSRETNLRSWVWPTVSNRLSRQCQLALDWPSASSRWLCSDGQWILYRQSLPPDGCVQMDSGFFIDSHCLPMAVFRWTVDSSSAVTASRWLCSYGQWILYRQSLPPDSCVQMDSGFFIDSHCLPLA